MPSVGFLGSGNMVRALALGMAAGSMPPTRMLFTDSGSGRAAELAARVGGEALESNHELAARSDLLVVGCKPKDLERAASDARAASQILSILGATPLAALRKAFPGAVVQRAMPNVAVEVGAGVTCLADEGDEIEGLQALLGQLGLVENVPEAAMDAATAVMGCSPAYVDCFLDVLTTAGEAAGLRRDVAREFAIEAIRGTAVLAGHRAAGEIRDAVASPGGSTEAGLDALVDTGFTSSVTAAVEASLARMRGDI